MDSMSSGRDMGYNMSSGVNLTHLYLDCVEEAGVHKENTHKQSGNMITSHRKVPAEVQIGSFKPVKQQH